MDHSVVVTGRAGTGRWASGWVVRLCVGFDEAGQDKGKSSSTGSQCDGRAYSMYSCVGLPTPMYQLLSADQDTV